MFRINLCLGDWLHWHGEGCVSYKGKPAQFGAFAADFMDSNQITDLICHADQRTYHKAAIEAAQARGIRVFVTELGLLRSGWMSLEREGLATLSRFPSDPGQIRAIADRVGEVDFTPAYPKSAYLEIVPDVLYNLANEFLWFLYPHYQRHTIYPPILEYIKGGWRMLRASRRNQAVARQIEHLKAEGCPYFVLPLQLEGDFQLRAHSPYKSFAEVIDTVFASFTKAAPRNSKLVLKTHPLDAGFENWPQTVEGLAAHHGLSGRVLFLDGGRLDSLFEQAAGLVTLNSTAGLEAIQAGVPVKTLVPAHYSVDGLTYQGALDAFWTEPGTPDEDLLAAYLKAIAGTIQIRGSIHCRQGTQVAADNLARRVLDLSVNEPGAFVEPPPRLDAARALGVPL
ncbi:capsule biosynthesis protein [Roseibium litorale]|uniref:capsule biosynthesis protein n=1 Tax=Roseibium litorale TaxID=2803841 RepID=UPI001AD92BF5